MEKAISEKSGRIIEKSIILFFLILPLATIALKLNNDAWFLLAHGKHVFTEGIPFVEPFTIHENFDFVMQQWLFSAVFWFLYNSLGEVGLIAGVFLCAIILMLLLYKLSLLVSCNAKKNKRHMYRSRNAWFVYMVFGNTSSDCYLYYYCC